jgi:putative inorganic carbon (hco3(-)) transporter
VSLTALVWALLYGIALIGALMNPLFGLFGYLLEYFQRPALYWWGDELPDLRWNFTIAVATGVAYLIRRGSLPTPPRQTWVPLALMLLQAINTTLVTQFFAVDPDLSLRWSTQFWKLVVTFALFSGIVRTPRALDLVIMFMIIGCGYWGWDALDNRRVRGRLEGIGSGDTQNSNLLAAHLLTIIPLMILVAAMKKKPAWMRVVAIVATPLVINLLILGNSRAATLGLLVAAAASFVLVRSGLRKHVMMGAMAAGLALFLLADQQFIERQQTISSADDNSSQSRLDLWRGSLGMIADYPLGTGGRGFHVLSPRYVPELQETNDGEGRSSHNTYIQVAADWGLQGLALFLALIGYTFVLLHRVRAERAETDWPYFVSLGLQLGLIGTLTAGFFSNRFFGESIYWLCALATSLYCMTQPSQSEAEARQQTREPAPAAA